MGHLCILIILLNIVMAVLAETLYDFTVLDHLQQPHPLSKYRNASVILVVNVASNCGYTYINYRELSDMYDKYHSRGLEILAFPSNQFGEMEPASDLEINSFIVNYGITFPVFAKINVNGPSADAVFRFLKENLDHAEIGWNFHKFLVVKGMPIKRYASKISPKKIEIDLVKYLRGEHTSSFDEDSYDGYEDDAGAGL